MNGKIKVSHLTNIKSAEDIEDLESTLEVTLSSFGVRYFSYNILKLSAVVDISKLKDPQSFIITNYPSQFYDHYFREGYQAIDPIISTLTNTPDVIAWDELFGSITLTEKQSRLTRDASHYGLTGGISFSINAEPGESAVMSIVPDIAVSNDHFKASIPHIQIIAHAFHNKAKKLLIDRMLTAESSHRKSLLSQRESDVLHWIARGKTAWEIAHILAISQKSVEFYTNTAKNKLFATNRTHAVVKSLMMGLITYD